VIPTGTRDSLSRPNESLHGLPETAGKRVSQEICENGCHGFGTLPQGYGRSEPMLASTRAPLESVPKFLKSPRL